MTADKEISCSDSNDSNKDSNSDNNGNTDSNSDSDDDERDGNRGNPLGSNMAPLVASPPVFLLCRVLDTSNLKNARYVAK